MDSRNVRFEMDVEDTFFFADGRTVFTGPIKTNAKLVGTCECEIVKDGELKLNVAIEGEMMPSSHSSRIRALSTKQSINLEALGLKRGGFKLRSKAS